MNARRIGQTRLAALPFRLAHVRGVAAALIRATPREIDPTALATHPFLQDGRLFAHNGVVGGLDVLDARLAELSVADLVLGQTDSERVFALITASIRARGDDIGAGLVDALRWLADNVPIYAVNLLLCTATDMWALRYPEPNTLYVLERREPSSCPHFDMQTPQIHAQSDHLDLHPSVVFASEPMDDDPGWQLIDPARSSASTTSYRHPPRDAADPPAHQLTLADLSSTASASQHSA